MRGLAHGHCTTFSVFNYEAALLCPYEHVLTLARNKTKKGTVYCAPTNICQIKLSLVAEGGTNRARSLYPGMVQRHMIATIDDAFKGQRGFGPQFEPLFHNYTTSQLEQEFFLFCKVLEFYLVV